MVSRRCFNVVWLSYSQRWFIVGVCTSCIVVVSPLFQWHISNVELLLTYLRCLNIASMLFHQRWITVNLLTSFHCPMINVKWLLMHRCWIDVEPASYYALWIISWWSSFAATCTQRRFNVIIRTSEQRRFQTSIPRWCMSWRWQTRCANVVLSVVVHSDILSPI